jgi:hypothetical protein
MLPEKPRKFKKFEIDVDYQSTFADGVTLSVEENDTVKLIFYENTYKFEPNLGYDKDIKISRLKFEVRLSLTTLNKLAPIIFDAIRPSLAVDTVKIRAMHKLSLNTIKEIDKLGDVIIKRIFDTDDPVKYDSDIQEIVNSVGNRMLKDELEDEHK